jgi:hypothetical protein
MLYEIELGTEIREWNECYWALMGDHSVSARSWKFLILPLFKRATYENNLQKMRIETRTDVKYLHTTIISAWEWSPSSDECE